MPLTARAFWTVAPGRGEMRTESIGAEGVLVRARASGISRGTEALVFHGRVPTSQHATMRAPLMAGDFPFPVKYGYSVAGVTEAGTRVFVLHPHQDVFRAPEAMCVPIPDNVPDARAVLAANMETALNIAWDAAPLPGERILVVGAGVVGLLAAWLCARIPATNVTIVDIDVSRTALAESLGARFALPDAAPSGQDLAIHASASEAGLALCLDRAGFEARIVEASWYGDKAPRVPLGETFHQRRLQIVSSQVGAVSPALRARRSHRERLALALALLADARLDALVQSRTRFDDLPDHMPRLLEGGLCHVVTYGDS